MHDRKASASWRDAIFQTVGLWLFILLILRGAGSGDFRSLLLAGTIVIPPIVLALLLFLLFRRSLDWPGALRALALLAGIATAATAQTGIDHLFASLAGAAADVRQGMREGAGVAANHAFVFAVNVALFQFSFARRWSAARERALAEAREHAQRAQLTALRYQLNPHFLFNTLNSISALIVTRRNEDAEEMTERLSRFLRSSLASDPSELVPVDDELSLAEEYLDIEAVRFGRKLQVELECDPEAGGQRVPGFLVQPLVENAVKHGVAPSRGPVTVRIAARLVGDELLIRIENARVDIAEEEKAIGAGVGLANVRARLDAVYGAAASLTIEEDEGLFAAEIRLPASNVCIAPDALRTAAAGSIRPSATPRRDKAKNVAL